MSVSLDIDTSELVDLASLLENFPAQKAVVAYVAALNKAGAKASTQARRALVKQTGITYAGTRGSRGVEDKRATLRDQSFALRARGTYTPVSYFGARQGKRGVSARPWGVRRQFRGTFIARVGGHEGVFKRTAGRRIKELFGPNLAVELTRGVVPSVFTFTFAEEFQPNLMHEIDRVMGTLKPKRTPKLGGGH